jgi:hypothetical protein
MVLGFRYARQGGRYEQMQVVLDLLLSGCWHDDIWRTNSVFAGAKIWYSRFWLKFRALSATRDTQLRQHSDWVCGFRHMDV